MTVWAHQRVYRKPSDMPPAALRELSDALRAAIARQAAFAERGVGVLRLVGELAETAGEFVITHEPAVPAFPAPLYHATEDSVSFDELLAFTVDAAAALRGAHSAQPAFLHGGVCAAAFLRTPDGTLKLADFGVTAAYANSLTETAFQALAVTVPPAAPDAPTAIWELLPTSVRRHEWRLLPFLDYEKLSSRKWRTFRQVADAYGVGIVAYLLAHHQHPYLSEYPDGHLDAFVRETISMSAPQRVVRADLREKTGPIAEWRTVLESMISSADEERLPITDVVQRLRKLRPADRDPLEFRNAVESGVWTLLEGDERARLGGARSIRLELDRLAWTSRGQTRISGQVRATAPADSAATPIEFAFQYDVGSGAIQLDEEPQRQFVEWAREQVVRAQRSALLDLARQFQPRFPLCAIESADALPRANLSCEVVIAPGAAPLHAQLRWSVPNRSWDFVDANVMPLAIAEVVRTRIDVLSAAAIAEIRTAQDVSGVDCSARWQSLPTSAGALCRTLELAGSVDLRRGDASQTRSVRVSARFLENGNFEWVAPAPRELAEAFASFRPPPPPPPAPPAPREPTAAPKSDAPQTSLPTTPAVAENAAPAARSASESAPKSAKDPKSKPAGGKAAPPGAERKAADSASPSKKKPATEPPPPSAPVAIAKAPSIPSPTANPPSAASADPSPRAAKEKEASTETAFQKPRPPAPPPTPVLSGAEVEKNPAAATRKRGMLPVIVAGGVILVALIAYVAWPRGKSPETPPPIPPPPPPPSQPTTAVVRGACCIGEQSCQFLTAAECSAQDGRFLGVDKSCQPDPCVAPPPPPPPPQTGGACCTTDGACTVKSEIDCKAAQGEFRGVGSGCEPNPCLQPPRGACCVATPDGASRCEVLTPAACTQAGGRYIADGTECGASTCPPPRPTSLAQWSAAVKWWTAADEPARARAAESLGAEIAADLRLIVALREKAADAPNLPSVSELSADAGGFRVLPASIDLCGGRFVLVVFDDGAARLVAYVEFTPTSASATNSAADALARGAACSADASIPELAGRVTLPTVAQWQSIARAVSDAAASQPQSAWSQMRHDLLWSNPEWCRNATGSGAVVVGGITLRDTDIPSLVDADADLSAWFANPLAAPRSRDLPCDIRRIVPVIALPK